MPFRSLAEVIHTCHAAPLPFSDSAVSFVKVRVVDGNIRTASLLLLTTFVELRVVAGRSRTRAGRPHAVSSRPMLIHTYHTVPMPHPCRAVPWPWEVAFRTAWSWHGTGTVRARHGMCESNTAVLCKSNGKTQSTPFAERHGNGMIVWISLNKASVPPQTGDSDACILRADKHKFVVVFFITKNKHSFRKQFYFTPSSTL
jgi:hypothetical protein